MLCTIIDVKQSSSLFRNNTNITDAEYLRKIQMAESIILGRVGRKYTMPLGKYYENTLTFSGTGSTTGSMTITINGTAYVLAITSGLTAIGAADLFRIAAANSSDFIVNGLYSDEQVTINNQTADSYAEVTISSATQTVAGITVTNGNRQEVGIPDLRAVCAECASAFFLMNVVNDQGRSEGQLIMEKTVEPFLQKIDTGYIKLYDFEGNELATSSDNLIETYPNSASSDDEDNPTDNIFRTNDKI